MTKELLQRALDALRQCEFTSPPAQRPIVKGTITALRSALAAPMPESVHQFRQPGCSDWYDGTPDHHDGHGPYEVRTLYAAPPAAPADMVMVPREPTPEMIEAADQSDKEYSLRAFGPGTVLAQSGYDHWVAMIAAAPPAAPEKCDMADDGGCPTCGEDGGTSCGMPNCGLLQGAAPVVREPIIDEMDAVASRYAHKLALDLECVLSDYNGKWWDTAMQTIGEYRMAMNRIHERESPTHMGEPVLPKISSGVAK